MTRKWLVILDGDSRRLYCGDIACEFTADEIMRGFYDGDLRTSDLVDALEAFASWELAERDWSQDCPDTLAEIERRLGVRLVDRAA